MEYSQKPIGTTQTWNQLGAILAPFEQAITGVGGSGGRAPWSLLENVRTGLRDIDRYAGLLGPRRLVVVGSRPDGGRTSFAYSIARAIALQQECGVGLLSSDNRHEICYRLIAAEASIPFVNILTGTLNGPQQVAYKKTADRFRQSPLSIAELKRLAMLSEVFEKAKRLCEKSDPKLLVIDDIEMVCNDMCDYPDREERVWAMWRDLKILAGQVSIPIIAVTTVLSGKPHERPRLADLTHSDPIDQFADAVVLVHRSRVRHRSVAEVIIEKNGAWSLPGVIPVEFVPEFVRFQDLQAA